MIYSLILLWTSTYNLYRLYGNGLRIVSSVCIQFYYSYNDALQFQPIWVGELLICTLPAFRNHMYQYISIIKKQFNKVEVLEMLNFSYPFQSGRPYTVLFFDYHWYYVTMHSNWRKLRNSNRIYSCHHCSDDQKNSSSDGGEEKCLLERKQD